MFFAAYGIGNWNQNTLRLMFNQFEDYIQQPTYKNKLEIYSDGNDDYTTILPEYFHKDSICYGQKVKSLAGKKIFPALKRKIYGNPDRTEINTNIVESFNSILRESLSRLVRRTKCHTKNKYFLNSAVALFQFYWNFMHEIQKSLTPAILEKQATKTWTWGNFLHTKLSYIS